MTTMDEFLASIDHQLASEEHHTALRLANEARRKLADLYDTEEPELQALDPFVAGAVTDEWLDAVVERNTLQDRKNQRRNALVRLIAHADNRAAMSKTDSNAILAAYNEKLTELLGAARDLVDQLSGATSADTAIDKGVTQHWKALAALARDYQLLREAQMQRTPQDLITSARPSNGGEDHASDCYIKNLDDIWPTWRQPGHTPRTVRVYGDHADRVEPWPAEPTQLLLWLVTSPAVPWIPTPQQLRRLWEQRRNIANPNPRNISRRPANPSSPVIPAHYAQAIKSLTPTTSNNQE